MSLKKKLLAAAAVSALTAAAAVPAMALENEFHGMYKLKYFVSNIDDGGAGYYTASTTGAAAAKRSDITALNYFEQRARLMYIAKANDDLKLVTHFEIDSVFGDRAQGGFTNGATATTGTVNNGTAFRNSGGALEADAVNLETKHVYLDFKVPSTPVAMKVGIMPVKDAIKGIFLDGDIAGILSSTKVAGATINAGYFRAYEGIYGVPGGTRGVNNQDVGLLEAKYNVTKDIAVGAAYYLYYDYRDANAKLFDNVFALTAEAKVGPAAVSGFVAAQTGDKKNEGNGTKVDLSGYAANVAAKVNVGPGAVRVAALYTSGDKGTSTTKNKAWQSTSQAVAGAAAWGPATNSYNESGMMLLNRNAAAGGTSTDRAVAYTTNNNNQGFTGVFAGFDMNLNPKAYASANLGLGFASEKNNAVKPINKATGAVNSSSFLGTEVNVETGYKLYDNLTASVQAAYVVLGDYFKGSASNGTTAAAKDPDNPYTARIILSYTF